jgi:hypothetical protein
MHNLSLAANNVYVVYSIDSVEVRSFMCDRVKFMAWDSGCGRKVRYSKARHAFQQIRRISRLSDRRAVDSLETYHCRFCGGWHFGHLRSDNTLTEVSGE